MGQWNDVRSAVEDAVEGATWKVEPSEIPESLKSTWRAVEFGQFKGAQSSLKKAIASQNKELAAAANKVNAIIIDALQEEIADVKKLIDQGDYWLAFECCQQLIEQFNGIEMPPNFDDLKKSLNKEGAVKSGLILRKLVETSKKLVNSGKPLSKKIKSQLEKIETDYPNSGVTG
jgi:hypothetical protein